jgi:hypothetical protein
VTIFTLTGARVKALSQQLQRDGSRGASVAHHHPAASVVAGVVLQCASKAPGHRPGAFSVGWPHAATLTSIRLDQLIDLFNWSVRAL